MFGVPAYVDVEPEVKPGTGPATESEAAEVVFAEEAPLFGAETAAEAEAEAEAEEALFRMGAAEGAEEETCVWSVRVAEGTADVKTWAARTISSSALLDDSLHGKKEGTQTIARELPELQLDEHKHAKQKKHTRSVGSVGPTVFGR
jgi:hypothetical protein